MSLVYAALSSLLYGAADFSGGLATRRDSLLPVIFWSQLAGLTCALLSIVIMRTPLPGNAAFFWGAAAGLCGGCGLGTLYWGISRRQTAIVSPVSALIGALLPFAFGILGGERPAVTAMAGAVLALPAIVLLAVTPEKEKSTGSSLPALLTGLLAGAGFGGFFICISRPGLQAGFWPLVAARVASIFAVMTLLILRKTKPVIQRNNMPLTLLVGILDMAANIAFVAASGHGSLALVTIITATYPAPTVLLARMVLGERLGLLRLAGLALAIAASALISLG